MNLSRFQLIEIAGAISVVLSLLFVAFQINQTNQIARITTELETRSIFAELNADLQTNSEFASLLAKSQEPSFAPTPGERFQLSGWAYRYMNVWIASETAYDNGLLPETSYQVVLEDIRQLLQANPYGKQLFAQALESFPTWANSKVGREIAAQL